MQRTIAAAGVAGILCLCGAAFGQAGGGTAPSGKPAAKKTPEFRDPTNAALVYWPTFTSLAPETVQRLGDAYQALGQDLYARPDAEVSKILVERAELIEQIMRASRIRSVDWGLEWSLGANAIIAHLGKLRLDARFLGLDARRLIVAGEIDAAAERVAAMHRMATHAPADGPLICALVGASMSSNACTETEVLIADGRLTDKGKRAILDAMTWFDHPDPFRIRLALQGEKAWTSDWIRRNAVGPEAGKAAVKLLSGMMEETPQTKVIWEKLALMDEAALHAELDKLDRFYAEAIQIWDAAPDQAKSRMEALNAEADAGKHGMLLNGLAPAISKTYESDQRARKRFNDIRTRLTAFAPATPAQPATTDRDTSNK